MDLKAWIKTISFSLLTAIVGYLLFSLFYCLFKKDISFEQALISPMTLCFSLIVFASNVISWKKRLSGKDRQ